MTFHNLRRISPYTKSPNKKPKKSNATITLAPFPPPPPPTISTHLLQEIAILHGRHRRSRRDEDDDMGMLRLLVWMLGCAFMAYYVMVLAVNIVTAVAAYEMDTLHVFLSDPQTVFPLFVRPILDAIIVYILFWVLLPRPAWDPLGRFRWQ